MAENYYPLVQVTVAVTLATTDDSAVFTKVVDSETVVPADVTDYDGAGDLVHAAMDRIGEDVLARARGKVGDVEVWMRSLT